MSRVLLFGASPLPPENTLRTYGPSLRTWQLVRALRGDGHDLKIVGARIPESYPARMEDVRAIEVEGLRYESVAMRKYFEPGFLQRVHDDYRPEAVVFAHASVSHAPGLLDTSAPVWFDVTGHMIMEAQARAGNDGDDAVMPYHLRKEWAMLSRGDRFSAVSRAQAMAMVGELGLAGRLTGRTSGELFVDVIPLGFDETECRHDRNVLRGIDVAREDFVVLWSGGFNNWTDEETMYEGLIAAMSRNPRIHFVATGGAIAGHDERTYPRFVGRIESGRFRERFHLKGWLPREEVPSYYFEADVGINCEKDMYETRMGSKNRVLDWARAALPAATSLVSELSEVVRDEGVGFVFPPHDPEAMARVLLDAAGRGPALHAMGERARVRLGELYDARATARGLREWAARPVHAADFGAKAFDAAAEIAKMTSRRREGLVRWAVRVVRNSYRSGGAGLVARRIGQRLFG